MARYSIVKRHRDYYKYGTEPNANIVGSFGKIEKNIASGFSTSNYLMLPEIFNPTSNTWEMVFKIKTNNDVSNSTTQQFLGGTTTNFTGVEAGVVSSKFKIWLGSTGSEYNIANGVIGSYSVLPNMIYWVKIAFDGSTYTLDYSFDGQEYTNDINIKSSTVIYGATKVLGLDKYSNANVWNGSIDLSQSYININGERWWSDDEYTLVGSWIDDGIVSGFTTSNYLTLPRLFRPENNPWERVICFRTSNDITTVQQLTYINYASDSIAGVHFYINGGKIGAQIGSNGSSWDIAETFVGKTTLSTNTTYYAMIRFTGSAYQLLLSTTGEFNGEETLENRLTSSTPIYQSNTVYDRLGFRSSSLPQVFLGAIDLTQSYSKINNTMWWYGTKGVEVPSSSITDFGSYKYFKNVVTTKYWKEITTEVEEDVLAYAAYVRNHSDPLSNWHYYAKTPLGEDLTSYASNSTYGLDWASGVDDIIAGTNKDYWWTSVGEETGVIGGRTMYRRTDKDIYAKGMIPTTTIVEGTPEDYTYTTEEIVPVEVTADDEYDFTEFVPSAEFDYYEDRNKLYNITKRHRDYYKYGTELDATVVGSFAKLDKGVASGFSTSNYLTYPEIFNISTADSWEMECKFTTGSNITTQQHVLSSARFASAGSSCGAFIRVYSSKIQFIVPLTSNISSYISLEYIADTDTEYVVKGEFTGTAYNLYVNGEIVATKESTSKGLYNASYNDKLCIGNATAKDCPFLGVLDLKESYININGELWWSGDSYTKVGSWIEEGVVSGFSSSNCLIAPKTLPSSINSSEYVFKFTTGSSVTSPQYQVIHSHQSPNTWVVALVSGKFQIYNGSWVSGITTVVPNTTYFVRSVFNGSSWVLSSSTDGVVWTTEATWNTTTSYAGTNVYIGRDYDTTSEYFAGAIDLNKSYIKINNKDWWHGTKAVESTEADADYHVDSNKLYNFTRRNRTYYKNWTQPINPTGITASGWTNPTQAFDGVSDTYADTKSNSAYIEYDFGQEVYVTGFDAVGWWVNGAAHNSALDIYSVDKDGVETLIKAGTVGSASANYPTSAEFPAVKTSKVRFKTHDTLGYQVRIREITVSGYLDGTKEDYDYYIDNNKIY